MINANKHEVITGEDKGTKNSDKRQKCRSQTRRKGQERKTASVDLPPSLFIDPNGKWHKVKGSYKEGFMKATGGKKRNNGSASRIQKAHWAILPYAQQWRNEQIEIWFWYLNFCQRHWVSAVAKLASDSWPLLVVGRGVFLTNESHYFSPLVISS